MSDARKKPCPRSPFVAFARPWAPGLLLTALIASGCGADALDTASGANLNNPNSANSASGANNTNTVPSSGVSQSVSNDRRAVAGLTALPLSGCVPSVWYGSVTVGNSAFQLLVDSGSTTTAVAAENCSSCSALSPLYDVDGGRTENYTASTVYGDKSSWKGTIYTDSMSAKANGVALTPPVDVSFVAITTESDFFTSSMCPGPNNPNNGYQGILGLGPDTLLEPRTTSWMNAIRKSRPLTNDAYAVQLCDTGGRMWFGGYDPNFVTGEVHYTPMVQTGDISAYYAVKVADMQFAGTSLGLSSSALGSTVVDTGTSAFILPQAVFEKYAVALSADANFKANFPAKGTNDSILYSGWCQPSALGLSPSQLDAVLPTVGISFPGADGTGVFTLTLKASESYLFALEESSSGDYYYCSVMDYTSGIPILGSAMMREHVVVFDRANEQIGFVRQAPCNSPLPKSG